MTELLVDDTQTTLASSTTTSATTLALVSPAGLPSPSGGDFVRIRLEPVPANGTYELMLMTGLSGTTATVARAQEGTSGVAWAAGSKVTPVITALTLAKLPVSTQTLPNAGISAAAETQLHDCEAVSNSFGAWSANNQYPFGTSLGTNTVRFSTGTKSVYGIIYVASVANPNLTSQFWCDLAADQSVTSADTLALDAAYQQDGGGSLFYDVWAATEFWIADAVGLGGNVVKHKIPADTNAVGSATLPSTITFDFGGLSKVRSFGFVIVANTDAAADARLRFIVDHVRVNQKSDVEIALGQSTIGGAIVAAENGALANFSPRNRTLKTVWDQRSPGGFWSRQFGRHIREFVPNIDITGGTDVSDELSAAIRQLEPGETLTCDPDSLFRVDSTVEVANLERNVLDWQGSRFYTTVDHTDGGGMFRLGRGYNIKMRNFSCFGFVDTPISGSTMELSTGTPVISGATYTLPTLGDSVRNPHKAGSTLMRYFARMPDESYQIDLTLSASAVAVNDCMITLIDEFGVELFRDILTLTTTPTTYRFNFTPTDLVSKVEWQVTKNTSATSTITVTDATQYGIVSYDATKALFAALVTDSGVNGLLLEDFTVEGFGGDGFQCSNQANRITLRKFMSRANRRQGISINGNKDGALHTRIDDFVIISPARHGIDLEPETNGANVDDIRISNGQIYSAGLGGFVAQGWARISDMHISDIYEYPGVESNINFDGGAIDGTISRYFVDSTSVEGTGGTGQINPKMIVRGQNMMVYDCVVDYGFEFSGANNAGDSGIPLKPGGSSVDNLVIRRAGNHATVLNRAGARIGSVTTISTGEGFYPGKGATIGLAVAPVELTPGGSFSNLDLSVHRNQYPDTFKGIAHSSLWVPLGMNVGAEPVLGVRGLTGRGPAITVRSSTTVTTTTSSSAVTVTPYSTLRLMLDITAASGGDATLDVTVEASHDIVTWRPVGAFNQHTIACRETIDFFIGAETNLRVTATVAGTSSPSFTYSVTGRQHIPATHLNGTQAVTTSATTATCTFPTSTVPVNPSSFALAQGGTGGALTLLGTYYYRVAGRLRPGGPLVPLTEKNITLTGSNNSVKVTSTFATGSSSVAPEGLTIYRGTAAGVYNTRFDWLPNSRMWGTHFAEALVDNGETLVFTPGSEVTSGYPITTCRLAGSFTPIDETGYEPDALYKVQITPSWATTVGVTAKRRDGFDLAFGTAAPAGATVDWFLVR